MTKYVGPKTDGENVATQSDVGGSALSDASPGALTPDQAGAAGTANAAARADHAHEIICAAAGAILPDDVAAEGTALSFARSDHTHSISAAAPGTITPDASAAEGSSNSFARADHTHQINAAAPSSNLTATTTNAEGSSTSFARADHSHALTTGAPTSNLTASTTNATGTSASLSRADHSHAITTGTPGAIQPDDTAATGTSTDLARADHRHSIVAAAPSSNLTASTTNAEGTATSFARSDHSHAITTGTPGTIQPDDAAAAGTSASLARADHTHAIAAASAGTITGTNAEGTSTSFARADHNHAYGALSIPHSALALGPTYETSLPGSPVDGREIYYAADATNSIIWHLRYRSAARSGNGAWEFVGGSDRYSGISGDRNSTSTTYVTLTSGPSITVPAQGRYQVTYGAEMGLNGSGGSADIELGLADAGTVVHSIYIASIDQFTRQSVGETVIEDVATSATLDLRFRNTQGRDIQCQSGYIAIRPRYIF